MVKMGVDNGTSVFHVYLKYLQSQLNKTVLRRKKQHLLAPSVACPSRSPRFHTRFPQTLPGRSGCRPRATGSATPPSPGAPSLYHSRGPASRTMRFSRARPLAPFFISPMLCLNCLPLSCLELRSILLCECTLRLGSVQRQAFLFLCFSGGLYRILHATDFQ